MRCDLEPQDQAGGVAAGAAFLKALYSCDLELKINIDQGEMNDRILAAFECR